MTLNPGGGVVAATTVQVTVGDIYDLPTPTRTGFRFMGWYLGSTRIVNGSTVAITADCTFVARWTRQQQPIQPPVTPPRPGSGSQQSVDSETDPVDDTIPDTDAGLTDELISYVRTYSYDLAGNRTGFTLVKSGETVQDVAYTYDNLNRLSTVSESGTLQATYTYDANGNRASLTYANGTVETYSYNKANWITSLTNKKGSTVLSSYRYTYYASGSQKTETDHTGKVTSYTYDGLGRLTKEAETGGLTVNYAYDQAGNRAQMAVTGTETYTTNYTYDANNRLLTEAKTESGSTVTTTYTYDPNGNTLSKSTPAHGEDKASNTVYAYNSFNQLTGLNIDGTAVAYAYNAQGIRTAKRVNQTRTAYLLDGGNLVAEVQSNTVTDNYLRGINLIRRTATSETEYYLFNAHGDVVTTANPNGTINQSYDYDAFGVEKDPDTLDSNPFRYCGEYLDFDTGNYYLRARYYNAECGRMYTEDNYLGDIKDPLSLNLYIYCLSNPVYFADASGHLSISAQLWIWGFKLATKAGLADGLLEATLGTYRDNDGIYHIRQDYWQSTAIIGYNNFYDVVFDIATSQTGTSMDTATYDFTVDETLFRIWMWKGDYINLGSGGEVGIYTQMKINDIAVNHWLTATDYAMPMTLKLTDNKGNTIFDWAPKEPQWWVTGFNPQYLNAQADTLVLTATIDFSSNPRLYTAFKERHAGQAGISCNDKTYVVTIRWT